MAALVRGIYELILTFPAVFALTLNENSACYGTTGLANFLSPRCADGEKMAVVGLSAGAKKLSTGCPVEMTPTGGTVDPSCCSYDPEDCAVSYSTSVYRTYYSSCNGNDRCIIQASWINTPCNTTVYLERTNYMKMDYYCISDQGLDSCQSINTRDTRVFLWNPGYPAQSLTGTSSCTCSVEASCDTNIRVTAIDLRLASATSCAQSITIIEGGNIYTFDCSSNNDYIPTVLYTSNSHFIEVQIDDNLESDDGYFFILLEGTSQDAELTLSCSLTASTSPITPAADLLSCPGGFSTTTNTDESTTARFSSNAQTTDVSDTTTLTLSTLTNTRSTSIVTATVSTLTTSSPNTDQTSQDQSPYYSTTYSRVSTLNPSTSGSNTTDEPPNTKTAQTMETSESDSTPTFVSLPWMSTEKHITGTSLSYFSFESDSTTSTNLYTDTLMTTTFSNATTEINVANSVTEKSSNSLVIGIVISLIVLIAIIGILLWYKDRLFQCCTKSKVSVDEENQKMDNVPFYQTIFDENLNNIRDRPKHQQLPPLQHHMLQRSKTQWTEKSNNVIEEHETLVKKKKKKKKVKLNRETKPKKEKTKKKKHKKDKVRDVKDQEDFTIKPNTYTNSSFPSTFSSLQRDFEETPKIQGRRTSVLDISYYDGNLERSIEV